MHTIQISDGHSRPSRAGSEAEIVEKAVRRCAAEFDDTDDELIAAVEAGLADMRDGNYTTIDAPESREAFWNGMKREVDEKVAAMRAKAPRSGT